MKKFLSLLLVLLMALSLAACGGKDDNKPADQTPPPADNQTDSQKPADSNEPAEPADPMAELVAAAQAEGELVVYGRSEERRVGKECRL